MDLRSHLLAGHVIPAQPLALDRNRKFSEKHQRALTRYYVAAGAGGLAVGVHSTQFEIRDPQHNLFKPVLELAARTVRDELAGAPRDFVLIAGICGQTKQAITEAELALALGYQAGLVSMAAFRTEPEETIVAHVAAIAKLIPVVGFYLQPAVGGRVFSYAFWRKFADIPGVVAIKMAPFNRYQTIDVIRAITDAGRDDIALYTGNDDSIITDLLTPHPVRSGTRRIVGGLLGQWAVWTHAAVNLLERIHALGDEPVPRDLLRDAAALTEANSAIFDAANSFSGCIPGIHEVLRRRGLLAGTWCLDPGESLSRGQSEEITRAAAAYPELTDDAFVAEHLDRWLA